MGKSTILLQLAGLLAPAADGADDKNREHDEDNIVDGLTGGVLYASGEESVEQVAGRAERMGVNAEGIYLYSATRLENILEAVAKLKPSALVVDSIQTVFLEDATGSPGSVSQVRECATALLHAAKTTGMPVFIVGHVTKSGDMRDLACWNTSSTSCCISRATPIAPCASCADTRIVTGPRMRWGCFR